MYFSTILRVLPLAGGAAAGSVFRRDDGTQVDTVGQTKQFIIEVEEGTDVDALAKELDSNADVKILSTYESDVFRGLSIETDGLNLDALAGVSGVGQAWPNSYIEMPPIDFAEQSVKALLDDAQPYNIHSWTGVDKAHLAGVKGKGVKVAVVDTGVDYTHPALGGGFGAGFKVSGGWDLVGEEWPIKEGVPDDDPMDTRGHGTHVAGIVAGETDWFTGVAPEAEILAYKVFTGGESGTYDSFLIDAFLLAYEDGADVITASIGAAGGWSNGPWATVASRIAESGVIVTIAASNSGSEGAFYANSGSSGKEVIAVASAEAGTLSSESFELVSTLDGKTTRTKVAYRYSTLTPWDIKDVPVHALFEDGRADNQACTAADIPADTPDLSDKIVLVRHSACDYTQIEFNLRAYNVSYMLFYSGDDNRPDPPAGWLTGPKAIVEKKVGEAILETIRAGGKVAPDFTKYLDDTIPVGIRNGAGNRPSEFTSWGGLYDLDLKPDVAAPGGEILSAWPGEAWRVASGTSMATPYLAGVAALWLSRFPSERRVPGAARRFADKVRGTASTMPWAVDDLPNFTRTGFLAPTIQVGSGLVDAWRLLEYTTALGETRWALNDTDNFAGRRSVAITNNGKAAVTYEFSLQPAAGVEAAAADGVGLARLSAFVPVQIVPDVKLPGSLTVGPGETKKAEIVFDYPRGLNATKQPLYSGKVLIDSSLGEQLSVAYFGAAYSLKEQYKKMFIKGSPVIRSKNLDLSVKSNFTFDTTPTAWDYPKVWLSLIFGCDELRWDIYEAGWTESRWSYPPVVGQGGYIGAATSFRDVQRYPWFDPAKNDPEDTVPFPVRALTRSIFISPGLGYTQHEFYWLGKLGNGTYITPGKYQMRFAALRPLGDRTKSEDWEVWKTPEITVLPKPKKQ